MTTSIPSTRRAGYRIAAILRNSSFLLQPWLIFLERQMLDIVTIAMNTFRLQVSGDIKSSREKKIKRQLACDRRTTNITRHRQMNQNMVNYKGV